METYSTVGYPCENISFLVEEEVSTLKASLLGKTLLLSGNSGVGKSTLINALDPSLNQKIGTISTSYQKGKHTTTFAQMFHYAPDSFIIDTPGIKDFGLVYMEKVDLSDYFIEMQGLRNQCKFNDCLHIEEPGCAVLEALDKGQILPSRYLSYLTMLEEIDQQK
jgi:ribosome biogenesis GTPase